MTPQWGHIGEGGGGGDLLHKNIYRINLLENLFLRK